MSNVLQTITRNHFDPPYDFLDLFLPVNASSPSRARAFLWLIFHYLEASSARNPFGDEPHTGKVPRLVPLPSRQKVMENVDTPEEIAYGKKMAKYRSKFLQKQIADEEKEKNSLGQHGAAKGDTLHLLVL